MLWLHFQRLVAESREEVVAADTQAVAVPDVAVEGRVAGGQGLVFVSITTPTPLQGVHHWTVRGNWTGAAEQVRAGDR